MTSSSSSTSSRLLTATAAASRGSVVTRKASKPNFVRIPQQLDPYGRTHLLMERQAQSEWVAHLKQMRDWNALPPVAARRTSGPLRFSGLEDFDSAHDDYDALLDTDYDHVFHHRHELLLKTTRRPVALTDGAERTRKWERTPEDRPAPAPAHRDAAELLHDGNPSCPTSQLGPTMESSPAETAEVPLRTGSSSCSATALDEEAEQQHKERTPSRVAPPTAARAGGDGHQEELEVTGLLTEAAEGVQDAESAAHLGLAVSGIGIESDPVTEYDLELLKEDRDADYAPGPFLDDSESGGGIHCRKHKGHWQKRRRQIAGNVNTKWRRKLAKKAGWMH